MINFKTKFDDSSFPIVNITFGDTISDDDVDNFEKFWLKQYSQEKDFYLVLDTSNLKNTPISHIYKLSKFTKKLKCLEKQYLKASILLVNSKLVRGLYYLYLKIQKPISEVHIVSNKEEIDILVKDILKKNIINKI